MVTGPNDASAGSRRRFPSGNTYRLAGLVAAIALVGGLVATQRPTAPPPASTATPSGAATTPVPAAAWAPLQLDDLVPLADLSASTGDTAGIETTSTFRLHSRTSTPAVELAARLTADPAVAFTVTPGATADTATLTTVDALAASTLYHVRLTAPDGSASGSWAFRTKGPLKIASLLPSDKTTDVPTDTGIEVAFDQPGTTGFEAHFSIDPAVPGAFEAHYGTWVFVPSQPLAPGTVYTYTISAGVAVPGSDVTLEQPVHVSFETALPDSTSADTAVAIERSLLDSEPGSRAVVGIDLLSDSPAPKELPVRVYRLPTPESAIAAVRRLDDGAWANASDFGLVDTAALKLVAEGKAAVTNAVYGAAALHLPFTLPQGWYVVDVPRKGRDGQTVLQVTTLAVYALTSTTRMVVWANDIATGLAMPGVRISTADGMVIGATDATGLFVGPTPAGLIPPASGEPYDPAGAFVTLRTAAGSTTIAELGAQGGGRYQTELRGRPVSDPWWSLLQTDRSEYRSTDTLGIWGVAKARSDGRVPASIEIRVTAFTEGDPGNQAGQPPIALATVKPSSRGAFVTKIGITDLPTGSYLVSASVDGALVSTTAFEVGAIVKPAYVLTLTPARHAYIVGAAIKFQTEAAFYDGSRAPGLRLRVGQDVNFDGQVPTEGVTVTSGADGLASGSLVATMDGGEPYQGLNLVAGPVDPEEGQIVGTSTVFVFESRDWLDGAATLSGGRLHLSGKLSEVDLAKVERQVAAGGWPESPGGRALGGRHVSVRVVHLVPVKHQIGTDYDFIEKRAVPVYEIQLRDVSLGTFSQTTSSSGGFALSLPIPNQVDEYRVEISASDAQGRKAELTVFGERPFLPRTDRQLVVTGPGLAHVGKPVTVTVERNGAPVSGGRYLFITAHLGIKHATLQDNGSYTRTFEDQDLPNLTIRAVRWTSAGYEIAGGYGVSVAPADKTIEVSLHPDHAAYRPGDTVHLDVETARNGRPVAADVIVRADDQKLYDLWAASDISTPGALLADVPDGLLQSYTSQFAPGPAEDTGYGDGGGDGGPRDSFQDTVAFQLLKTDASGHGRVTFQLSDDLTSWHVAASAITNGLDSGDASILLPVSLPFFVEMTVAPDYLVGERPVLRVRAFGPGLKAGDPVRFTVAAPSLGQADTVVDGFAFESVRVPLPVLTDGDHAITVSGREINGTGHDAIMRTIHVRTSRVAAFNSQFDTLAGAMSPPGGPGLSTYVVTDAGRGALLSILEPMAEGGSARFDRSFAAEIARGLLIGTYGLPAGDLPSAGFDATRYQRDDGVALLPYSSPTVDLAALAALVDPSLLDRAQLRLAFQTALANADGSVPILDTLTRAQALAGLAGLGDDVLGSLADLGRADLQPEARVWLALGYLASGDEPSALAVERAILAAHGESLGAWVRVDAGDEINDLTALMLLLAGSLGDPVAARLSSYLADNARPDQLYVLEQLGYARASLDRLPKAAGRFAWTVYGKRQEVQLEPGGSFSLSLTAAQVASFRLEPIAGQLRVASLWQGPISTSTFSNGAGITLTREVAPAGSTAADQLVTVTLTLKVGRNAPYGCYRVTDTAPSGLAPLSVTASWPEDDGSGTDPNAATTLRPYQVDGQRVVWCATYGPKSPLELATLSYRARVVSPGTYSWEPAIVQLESAPTVGAMTAPSAYEIR